MKIIKLFLFFSLMVWAEFKLDIPQNIDVRQLENIVKNGWTEDNKTLNDLIVSNAERVMPEILEKIKKPVLRGVVTEADSYPVPQLLLSKDDYLLILSYIKYLENNKSIHKAKVFYVRLYSGLSNIEDKSFLGMLSLVIYQTTIADGLLSGLNKNYYSKNDLDYIKKNIELLLDNEKYFEALEYEQISVLNIMKKGLLKKSEDDTLEYRKLMSEIYQSFDLHFNFYFNEMEKSIRMAMKNNSKKVLDDFNIYMKKEKDNYMSFKNKMMFAGLGFLVKFKNMFMIGNESYGFFSEFTGKTLALTAVPKVASSSLEYIKLVEKNKKLLHVLKR